MEQWEPNCKGKGCPRGLPRTMGTDHVPVLEAIHKAYAEAGSDVVTTNTFGANRMKLSHLRPGGPHL